MTLPRNLPALLRARGLDVEVIDGWETRGRPASTGGFAPVGSLWHHTGERSLGWDHTRCRDYARWLFLTGRSDLPAPLCHLSTCVHGVVFVGAAGRANHAGVARAAGSVAAGDGNTLYVGIENQNDGSQGWAKPQHEAMIETGACLHEDVLHTSVRALHGHRETSVTGKWDPGLLDLDQFRHDVAKAIRKPDQAPDRPAKPTRVETANGKLADALKLIRDADELLGKAPSGRTRVHRVADDLDGTIRALANNLSDLPKK